MKTSQTIAIDFEEEIKNTRKLLERVPLDDAHRSYQPHPKSMPLDKLATHVAELPAWAKILFAGEVFELPLGFKPRIAASAAELLEIFDQSAAEGRDAIAAAADEDMQKTWTFKYGDFQTDPATRTHVLRSFINHMVHHRAQLGVYLRLNEIPIPGMYGPSADDGWPASS